MPEDSVDGELIVPGFRAGAVSAGIRYKGRSDLALIVSEVPAAAAGVFTTNRVQAAPVKLSREHLLQGPARAIVVNSGIANACTGGAGMEHARAVARLTATALGCRSEEVLVASTGVIGTQLPVEPVAAALPQLAAGLRADGWKDAASAIMTTDKVAKYYRSGGELEGRSFTVLGIAKGAGMICPHLATMLAFVATDAAVHPRVLQSMVREESERSFNRITVDGDTSTNDMLLMLANGLAGNRLIEEADSAAGAEFRRALAQVLLDLARKIVADGEGATKMVRVRVAGASSQAAALEGARTVANSPLVKTALFGADPNWGRIMAALGRAPIDFDPNLVAIYFDRIKVVENGVSVGEEAEKRAARVLRRKELSITVDLRQGEAEESVYTCDLSMDYVRINAEYRS